ncbi:MAG: isoprenyl transferase [Neisseriaceae bacterium]|nr:isoprenyl transferase [Neisseriaceae bacterium]
MSLPRHIAVIMDGNGRWSKDRAKPRHFGHKAGLETLKTIIEATAKRGIRYLTVFAFGIENWLRPSEEVNYLMSLFLTALKRDIGRLHEHGIQVQFIGDRKRINPELLHSMQEAESLTSKNSRMTLIVAFNYSGRWDIEQACQQLAQKMAANSLSISEIDEKMISDHLSTATWPDPDLFIRTSGEQRLSNFLLWQLSYAELYFTEKYWPEFDENELEKALLFYAARERRFGQISEQIGGQHA